MVTMVTSEPLTHILNNTLNYNMMHLAQHTIWCANHIVNSKSLSLSSGWERMIYIHIYKTGQRDPWKSCR